MDPKKVNNLEVSSIWILLINFLHDVKQNCTYRISESCFGMNMSVDSCFELYVLVQSTCHFVGLFLTCVSPYR